MFIISLISWEILLHRTSYLLPFNRIGFEVLLCLLIPNSDLKFELFVGGNR